MAETADTPGASADTTGLIFINYRRGDDPGTTGRLYDRLEAEFDRGQLFMDVEGHIRGGDDFVEVLKAQVARCDVLLAIIGPRWLTIADESGRRRLDNPEDWVRVEIAGALESGKRVIPVLVGGAAIPRAEQLPDDLKPLARRQVIRITLERFKADAQGLVSQMKAALEEIEKARAAATEAERKAAEEAAAKRKAEEQARAAEWERQEAERARQQAMAGLSPEDINRALELENWTFVKDRDDPAELRDHIARYGGGETERFAWAKLASLEWAALGPEADQEALIEFLDEFPNAPEAEPARAALQNIEEREAREKANAAHRQRRQTGRQASEPNAEPTIAKPGSTEMIAFGIVGWPFAVWMGGLFKAQDWSFLGSSSNAKFASGTFVALAVLLVTAWYLASERWRSGTLGGTELALYSLVCGLTFALGLGTFFASQAWGGANGFALGVAVALSVGFFLRAAGKRSKRDADI